MDVYSPSHPTDQDGECEAPSLSLNDIAGNEPDEKENTRDSDNVASDSEVFTNDRDYCLSKSPDLSPTLSSSSGNPDDALNVQDKTFCESVDMPSSTVQADENKGENGNINQKEEESDELGKPTETEKTLKKDFDRDKRSHSRGRKSGKERSRRERSPSHKGPSNHLSASRSRHRSRSPKRKRDSRSTERSSQRRSSSRSHYRRGSRSRRHSRSKSKDSRRRHSRSTSRGRCDRHRRDLYHKNRGSRSRGHQQHKNRGCGGGGELIRNEQQGSFISTMTELIVPSRQASNLPLQEMDSRNNPSSECQYDMDETSTPDISEEQNPGIRMVNENAVFVFQQGQAPPPVAANFINWSNQVDNLPPQFNQGNLQSIPTIQNAFQQQHHSAPPRFSNSYQQQQLRSIVPPRDFAPPPPSSNLMSQRPPVAFNSPTSGIPRFPPSAQLMGFNGMLNPLLNPFALLTTQPPPPPPPPPFDPASVPSAPHQQFIQQLGGGNPVVTHFQPPPLEIPRQNSPPPPPPPASQHNLLETLMTKAGLSADGLHSNNPSFSMSAIPLPESVAPLPTFENKSPMKKISKLLNSAASNLLNASRGANPTSSSPPPPPPPPLPTLSSGFPPLPPISEIPNGNGNAPSTSAERKRHKKRPEYIQQMLSKKRRSDFVSSREWQERIAMEVKGFIKPYYVSGKVSKEDCRTVLKRSVNKIFKSKCTLIETRKIGEFVKLYLKKYQKYRKWQARQQEKMQLELQAANKEPTVQ